MDSHQLSSMDEGLQNTAKITTEITVTRSDKHGRVEETQTGDDRDDVDDLYDRARLREQHSRYPLTEESRYPVREVNEYPVSRPNKAYKVLGPV